MIFNRINLVTWSSALLPYFLKSGFHHLISICLCPTYMFLSGTNHHGLIYDTTCLLKD